MLEGETQMRRTARLLVRAILCSLLLLAVSASVAVAESAHYAGAPGSGDLINVLPEDPGLE